MRVLVVATQGRNPSMQCTQKRGISLNGWRILSFCYAVSNNDTTGLSITSCGIYSTLYDNVKTVCSCLCCVVDMTIYCVGC